MIVKNEEEVIARCLASVKPCIDRWVIVDTGSIDGTREKIRESLQGIEGELHDDAWVDFATNRNRALSLAKGKGDYALFIDADEVLVREGPWPLLTLPLYHIQVRVGTNAFYRPALVDLRLDWVWEGALHECIYSTEPNRVGGRIDQAYYRAFQDGGRSRDPGRPFRDIAVLEQAIARKPESGRDWYFLAQSYCAAGQSERAVAAYRKRICLGGEAEEVFYSHYMIARIEELEGRDGFIDSYWKAYENRKTRLEPLYWIARHFLAQGRTKEARALIAFALQQPKPRDQLNVDHYIYDRGFKEL